jgi:hypothetical protein
MWKIILYMVGCGYVLLVQFLSTILILIWIFSLKSTHVTKSYNSNHWLEWPTPHQCTSPTELVLGFVCWLKLCFFLIKILTSCLPSFVFPPSQTYFSFLAFSISSFFLARVNQHPPMHQLVVLHQLDALPTN